MGHRFICDRCGQDITHVMNHQDGCPGERPRFEVNRKVGRRPGMLRRLSIVTVLEQEIVWCKEHPDSGLSDAYQTGFIKGLEQAILLIAKLPAGDL